MKNNITKAKKDMEALISLYDAVLQSGLLDKEKKYLVEAVMFFAKEALKHIKNGESAEKHDRPKEEIDNIYKKCGYCMLAATALYKSL